MKNKASTVILFIVFLIGLSLLLYPSVSNYWNSFRQSRVIASYSQTVADMDEEEYEELWAEAQSYNQSLQAQQNGFSTSSEMKDRYDSMLNPGDDGVMGYLEIPTINVKLPIYHGTADAELQVGVGHLEWTSLPVGGESTHCALSGHRGLPSAKLLSNLDQMKEGDEFYLRILGNTLTYEVDQIRIVEPEDVSQLKVEEGQDLCTLVTCTPYGVNTHRLLVRGHRIENSSAISDVRVTADAIQIEPILVAPLVATPILLVLLVVLLVCTRKKKK